MTDLRAIALLCLMLQPSLLCAQTAAQASDPWKIRKCELYSDGWDWVLKTQKFENIRPAFSSQHQEFIDQGCDHNIEICPVTDAEFKLADLLTIISMNEGMASTFVPFACPSSANE